MKATGEVMAIERTFGAALNKALRGLEQAGAGLLAEHPAWRRRFDVLAAVYAGAGRRTTRVAADASPIRWTTSAGRRPAIAPDSPSAIARAPIVLRASSRRPTRACGGSLALLRRGVPAATIRRRDRHRAVVRR